MTILATLLERMKNVHEGIKTENSAEGNIYLAFTLDVQGLRMDAGNSPVILPPPCFGRIRSFQEISSVHLFFQANRVANFFTTVG